MNLEPWVSDLYESHVNSVRATRKLNDAMYTAQLDSVGIYDLVFAATDDEKQASKACGDRAMARMRAGLKP